MGTMRKRTILQTGAIALFAVLGILAQDAMAASTWLGSVSCDVPTRIALDGAGNLYVTEARNKNRVRIYDRKGVLQRTLPGVVSPAGVAVDTAGRIYVVSTSTNSVKVYNADLTYSHAMGAGAGEFKMPNSVAVSAAGQVYVTDSNANKVKVYDADGTPAYSFGEWGAGAGQFNTPLALAINESAGELYVLDWGIVSTSDGPTAGARVQVFDLKGGWVRSWGQFGTGEGLMQRPLDLSLDAAGRVYVADGFQGVIHVFDGYGAPLETIFDAAHPTKTPIAVAIGRDNRVFIASNNQKNLEIFGMDGYTTLAVDPSALAFAAVEGAAAPGAQTVAVVNSGSGTLSWSAKADKGWLSLTPGAASLAVSVIPAGLAAGTYTGVVTITASTGAVETAAVTLTVSPPPAVLSVTPDTLTYKAQVNGSLPLGRTLDIRNLGGGSMSWTASSSEQWLELSTASGSAPAQVLASVTKSLSAGTHSAVVAIASAGAQNSPLAVKVTVTVTNTGTMTIQTNLAAAGFTITGPGDPLTGSGTLWQNAELAPGKYTVSFGHVKGGYVRPRTASVTVTAGRETVVDGTYAPKAAKTHLVAVTGTAMNKQVSVLTLDGKTTATFTPFEHQATDVQAAAGALDGSGRDLIVVTDGMRSVKVFTSAGAEVARLSLNKTQNDAVVAVGDIDDDGANEVLVGSVSKRQIRQAAVYRYADGSLSESGQLSLPGSGSFTLAVADLDGDQAAEVVVADRTGVQALTRTGTALTERWTLQGSFGQAPQVAAGDLDDDGAAEVVLGHAGLVQVLTGAGTPTGTVISAAGSRQTGVGCGDTDRDGADEIAAAATDARLYDGDGTPVAAVDLPAAGAAICLGAF